MACRGLAAGGRPDRVDGVMFVAFAATPPIEIGVWHSRSMLKQARPYGPACFEQALRVYQPVGFNHRRRYGETTATD